MSEALVSVIKEYPGWTMFCIVMMVFALADGTNKLLINIGRRKRE